ncbi:MAG: TetR family transcriptional regulator [Burkholderiaceae bacterium]|nr:TetR family transcriptional regulator [Burkholderiaceae bacterium]
MSSRKSTSAAMPAARRQPAQQRSHERLERILSVAKRLIADNGSDALRMSEIAAQAGISIGSLYQYFPDKRAILRTLAEQYTAESRRCIEDALAVANDKAGLAQAFSSLVDQYYAMFLDKPVRRDIIAGMRADKDLMAIELAESEANGAVLAAAIQRVHPKADAKRIRTLAFLIWQLGEETMRLALAHKRAQGALLVEAYKRMSLRAIAEP